MKRRGKYSARQGAENDWIWVSVGHISEQPTTHVRHPWNPKLVTSVRGLRPQNNHYAAI